MASSITMPHAVMTTFPAQGHIKGMLKLAKLLHSKGFYITFVNTEFNHNRFLRAKGSDSLSGFPNFQFKTIADGLSPSDPNATQDIHALAGAIRRNMLAPFLNLISELNENSHSQKTPPVTCIVSDGFMPFTITAGTELGIPVVVFFTIAACAFMSFYHYRALLDKSLTGFKDPNMQVLSGYMDKVVDWIPGMENIRLKDLPTIFQTTDPKDEIFHLIMEATETSTKASAVGLHTFDALEPNVLTALSPIFTHVYTIGPLQLLLNRMSVSKQLDSIEYSLWKEESDCLDWLDNKEPGSVVYVNFGSITVLSSQQLVEFAMGLANSKHFFLWIIRPDLVMGDSAILPVEFEVEAKERGMIASWCSQEDVLNHKSIGSFLTHCGWNSTIESLSAGVPMMCWPFFADQQTNCRYTCTKWEVGIEIDNNVKRGEIEQLLRELMEGEQGKRMKRKAVEWKKLAEGATNQEGSSSLNIDKLVHMLLNPLA